MSQNSLIKVLKANQLMRSPDEVAAFEQALAQREQIRQLLSSVLTKPPSEQVTQVAGFR